MRKFMLLGLVLALAALVAPGYAQDQTIAEIAAGNEDFSTLMAAVEAADPSVAEALSSEGELTVFAPTNDAFAATFEALGLDAETVLGDQELVTAILTYHVLGMPVMAEDAIALAPANVETLQGEELSVRLSGESVTVENATVVATDLEASNGVIHVIDQVIVPPSILQALVADATDLGTEDDPLTLLFIPSEDAQEVASGADELAELIEAESGFSVDASVSTDYAAAIEALCGEEAEIGALNTFGYILASQRGCAEVGVVSVRFGSSFYGGQIVVPADSEIQSLEDITTDTVFCRPDPLSTSGWIVPSIAMRAAGVDVDNLNVVDAGGHDGVISGVYNGECDAGASFVDARGNIEEENPDVFEQVIVIGESAPIPNDTLSFRPGVPEAMQILLVETLLDIAADEANAELLDQVYSWSGLARATDAFFDDFREQLDAAGLNIEELQ